VPRPNEKNPRVPEQLDDLLLWATERSPADPPPDAPVTLQRLREIERELGIAPQVARTLSAGIIREEVAGDSGDLTQVLPTTMTAPTTTVDDTDNATRLRAATKRRSAKGAWLLALVLLLAALAGGAGWWFGSGPGSQMAVPDVSGRSFAEAQQILAEQSLQAVQKDVFDLEIPAGVVVGTDPPAGSRLEPDATVQVLVSQGPQPQTVQALAGSTAADARGILQAINLTVAEPDQEFFADAVDGIVIAVAVAPRAGGDAVDCTQGCTALEGDTATLSVSVGPIPNVFGESVESATSILAAKDLSVAGTFEEFRDDLRAGLVVYVAQPDDGGSWRPGDSVMLAVSKGPEPIAVPNVVGKSVGEAAAELRGAGFEVNVPGLLEIFWEIYRVTKTDPAAGVLLAPGSTVTVTGFGL
jgi:serine/threonine-protein kinase